jgi:3',5'-nucleoside bisphosphate phosphatase
VIDLHLHTTASDGRLTPTALVDRAAGVGLTIISITDHDTTAGLAEGAEAAARRGLRLVNGIEITAVERGRDIHVLGYFMDPDSASLITFLHAQRADRLRRLTTMAERLEELGHPVDIGPLLANAGKGDGRTIGRPHLADALVAAGHAANRGDAFDRLLGEGRPAYISRTGATVGEVAAIVRAAGGIASLAHPGLMKFDDVIPGFVASGLEAIEVWHSDHGDEAVARYKACAESLGLAMSGGSDYHADRSHHAVGIGVVTLPAPAFEALEARARAGRPRASSSERPDA